MTHDINYHAGLWYGNAIRDRFNVIYAATQSGSYAYISKSTDEGANWSVVRTFSSIVSEIGPLLIDPNGNYHFWYTSGSYNWRHIRSTDGFVTIIDQIRTVTGGDRLQASASPLGFIFGTIIGSSNYAQTAFNFNFDYGWGEPEAYFNSYSLNVASSNPYLSSIQIDPLDNKIHFILIKIDGTSFKLYSSNVANPTVLADWTVQNFTETFVTCAVDICITPAIGTKFITDMLPTGSLRIRKANPGSTVFSIVSTTVIPNPNVAAFGAGTQSYFGVLYVFLGNGTNSLARVLWSIDNGVTTHIDVVGTLNNVFYSIKNYQRSQWSWHFGPDYEIPSIYCSQAADQSYYITMEAINIIPKAAFPCVDKWFAQQFVSSKKSNILGLKLNVFRLYGKSTTYPLIVDIYETSGGLPTGPSLSHIELDVSTFRDSSDLDPGHYSTNDFYYAAFFQMPVAMLNAEQMYIMVFSTYEPLEVSGLCYGYMGPGYGQPYIPGVSMHSINQGATWLDDDYDFQFAEYIGEWLVKRVEDHRLEFTDLQDFNLEVVEESTEELGIF